MNKPTKDIIDNSYDIPVVSVIMPIYNVDRYLSQALESIINQSYTNLEIICVDDGSTDSSNEVLQNIASKEPRIKIINKENGGYGSAVNAGINKATGEWIAILEPDDWIDISMYADMLCFNASLPVSNETQIIKTPYIRVINPDTENQKELPCRYAKKLKDTNGPIAIDKKTQLLRYHPSIWSALYKRSFLLEHNIKMKEVPGAAWTDNLWLFETMCLAKSIVYLNKAYYHYREETEAKSRAFWTTRPSIAFERWHDVQDFLDNALIQNKNILIAQAERAFSYIRQASRYYDVASSEDISLLINKMFQRIPLDIAKELKDVEPKYLDWYCSVNNYPKVKTNSLIFMVNKAKDILE